MTRECTALRPHLDAFFDGELRGPQVRLVLNHLESCVDCARELDLLRGVGDSLRVASEDTPLPLRLEGLAGTVLSRTRAEQDQSWLGTFRRATEDWHWFVVGAGSVAGTFVCTCLLSMLLAFGPKPEREDSLAALMNNLGAPSGCMFVVGSVDEDLTLLSLDDNCARVPTFYSEALVLQAGGGVVHESELVSAVADTVNPAGHFVSLDRMTPEQRRQTEAWLDELSRLRLPEPATPSGIKVDVHQIRMLTSVNAKAL